MKTLARAPGFFIYTEIKAAEKSMHRSSVFVKSNKRMAKNIKVGHHSSDRMARVLLYINNTAVFIFARPLSLCWLYAGILSS
ncbi:hypothetical protein [Rheinheimera soli]|uniref:hypothetical protein n=1 Tax=Rheinheimera soli TaxID=443616 RepID=UPI001E495720|nr:hypothetical protein [Rheinheimera soli]